MFSDLLEYARNKSAGRGGVLSYEHSLPMRGSTINCGVFSSDRLQVEFFKCLLSIPKALHDASSMEVEGTARTAVEVVSPCRDFTSRFLFGERRSSVVVFDRLNHLSVDDQPEVPMEIDSILFLYDAIIEEPVTLAQSFGKFVDRWKETDRRCKQMVTVGLGLNQGESYKKSFQGIVKNAGDWEHEYANRVFEIAEVSIDLVSPSAGLIALCNYLAFGWTE